MSNVHNIFLFKPTSERGVGHQLGEILDGAS